MKKYSQNNEQEIILKYFEGQSFGTYLDIGAYHPETFSNTKALYDKGWKGVLVEPAESNYQFIKEYFKDDDQIQIIQTCVGNYDGEITFYDSGGDAISTTIQSETTKWINGWGSTFTQTVSPIITVQTLLQKAIYKKFDFVSIDTEGTNFEILSQINFNDIGCRLVCVEYNGVDKPKYLGYMQRQGFRLIHSNGENLIFGK